MPQQLRPAHLESVLHSKRSHRNGKPVDHTERGAPLAAPRRSLSEDPVEPERKKERKTKQNKTIDPVQPKRKKEKKKKHIIVYDQAIKELGEGHYRSDVFCSQGEGEGHP